MHLLLELRPLDPQSLDLDCPCLDAFLDGVYLLVHLLQLVFQFLHLHDLLVQLRVRSGDGESRVRMCLTEASEGEAGVEDLAREGGSFLRERTGLVVVCVRDEWGTGRCERAQRGLAR